MRNALLPFAEDDVKSPGSSLAPVAAGPGARSSAGEHCVDIAGVAGSIPAVPTIEGPGETRGLRAFQALAPYSTPTPSGRPTTTQVRALEERVFRARRLVCFKVTASI